MTPGSEVTIPPELDLLPETSDYKVYFSQKNGFRRPLLTPWSRMDHF